MSRMLRRAIPTMFHRRLLLLAVVVCAGTGVLAARTAQLTLRDGAALRGDAERVLAREAPTPALRGKIYDRHGVTLAEDRTSYDVAVSYQVLSGQWVREQARRHPAERAALERQVEDLFRILADAGDLSAADLERRVAAIKRRVDRVAVSYWTNLFEQRFEASNGVVELRDVTRLAIREQVEAHVLIEDVRREAVVAIQRAVDAAQASAEPSVWREVAIRFETRRAYPRDEAAAWLDRTTLPTPLQSEAPLWMPVRDVGRHIVGGMRQGLWAEDERLRTYAFSRHNLHGYLAADSVGVSGAEAAREGGLRGQRGLVTTYRDGRPSITIDPVAGQDVTLTLDIRLQARVQALMDPSDPANPERPGLGLMRSQPWHRKPDDKPFAPKDGDALNGAAVVLEVATGEVLASVSVPWYAPEELADDPAALARWERINAPWRNRVVAQPYTPGSTIKPLVLAALYAERLLGYENTLACDPGYLLEGQADRFRCWIFKQGHGTHGSLAGDEALCQSCNMFFFRSGVLLGDARLRTWLERFGLGATTGSGLGAEIGTAGAQGRGREEAALNAIGQGPIEWTLLQAANAYATIARGGVVLAPTYIRDTMPRRPVTDLKLAPPAIEEVLRGMHMAANLQRGTAHHVSIDDHREPNFNVEGVEVYAKSGTADAPDLRLTTKQPDGRAVRAVVRQGDHAWTICMVRRPGEARPAFVIAVVVEYGGSGGAAAAAIANQIMHALRAEGYL